VYPATQQTTARELNTLSSTSSGFVEGGVGDNDKIPKQLANDFRGQEGEDAVFFCSALETPDASPAGCTTQYVGGLLAH